MPSIYGNDDIKRFLDKTADNLGSLKSNEIEKLFENLIETVLEEEEEDSSEIIEEILAFCSASVLEMIQSAKGTLQNLFLARDSLKLYSNFHVLISSVVSTVVKNSVSDFDDQWIDLLLESVISGLSAIGSETISLSGSSLIKILKWEEDKIGIDKSDGLLCKRLSKKLAAHPDFVAILTADMCAMFSRIEEVDSAPFLRIVRFCELLIDVSDNRSGLSEKIVETVEREFISKVYRTTLKTISSKTLPFKWSNELLKVCHRGNELVKPLVGEVFKEQSSNGHNIYNVNNSSYNGHNNTLIDTASPLFFNSDFIEIFSNERSRIIPEIVQLLFRHEETTCTCSITISDSNDTVINDDYYKTVLLKQLESFEKFKIRNFDKFKSISTFSVFLFQSNRQILSNWLPYVLKLKVKIETDNSDLRLHMDISKKLVKFLEL